MIKTTRHHNCTRTRPRLIVGAILAVALAVGGCADRGDVNFQEIIATAKTRVFPALVFVKPICEVYTSGEAERTEVFGSGVILSPDGYLITNHHVAAGAVEINCVLGDREQVPAVVVGLDPETDLALLKLELPPGRGPLPFATFAESRSVSEGQFVMALGSPFGFSRSISLGVVSNTRRYLGFDSEYQYNLWLQTDAAINPGNSGGPLVNTDGAVVGINTLGLDADGIGFAVPADVVKDIAERLKAKAAVTDPADWPVKVDRAFTGLQLQALRDFQTNTITPGYRVEEATGERGVLVRNVDRRSPAAAAGVLPGDLLLTIDGEKVEGMYVEQLPALRRRLADLPVDKPTPVTIARAGAEQTLTLRPAPKGDFEGDDLALRRWNLTVKAITRFSNPALFFQHGDGVYIQGVRYPGCARDAGLQVDDVILKIGSEPVKTLDDVRTAYERCIGDETLADKRILITIQRRGFRMPRVLDWTCDYLQEN